MPNTEIDRKVLKAKFDSDIQDRFAAGYNAGISAPNPYLATSNAWEAFEIGRWMHQTGRMIDSVRPSRGNTWKTGRGMVIRVHYACGGKFHITREQ